jgi:hypothetical protein
LRGGDVRGWPGEDALECFGTWWDLKSACARDEWKL